MSAWQKSAMQTSMALWMAKMFSWPSFLATKDVKGSQKKHWWMVWAEVYWILEALQLVALSWAYQRTRWRPILVLKSQRNVSFTTVSVHIQLINLVALLLQQLMRFRGLIMNSSSKTGQTQQSVVELVQKYDIYVLYIKCKNVYFFIGGGTLRLITSNLTNKRIAERRSSDSQTIFFFFSISLMLNLIAT